MTRAWRYLPLGFAAVAGALFVLLMPTRGARDIGAARPGVSAELRAAEQRWSAVRDSLWRHESALERAVARERAREIGALTPARGVPVLADAAVPSSVRAEVQRVVEQELSGVGAVTPRHPVAIVVTAASASDYRPSHRLIALPEFGDDPCVVVVHLSNAQVRGAAVASATERLLGTCAFYAAFGTPGAGMHAWLTATNMRSAGYLQPPASLARQSLPLDMPVSGAIARPALAGCRAGRDDACDALLDGADRTRDEFFGAREAAIARLAGTSGVAAFQASSLSGRRSVVESGLLAAIAADLGERRFTALWTHPSPPREAFETLEGRPLATWIADHVARTVKDYRGGPIPKPVPLVLGLGLLLGLAAVGVGGARKEV